MTQSLGAAHLLGMHVLAVAEGNAGTALLRRLSDWIPNPVEGASVSQVRLMLVGVATATAVMLVLFIWHTQPRMRYEANRRHHHKTVARAEARAVTEAAEQSWRWSEALEHTSMEYRLVMSSEDHIRAMLQRFRDRADAVKRRNLPPVGGEQRAAFVNQAKLDYHDFALISDAMIQLEDGVLTLRVDLRPKDDEGAAGAESAARPGPFTARYSGNPPRT